MVPYKWWEYWRRGVGRHLKMLWITAPVIVAGLLGWVRDNISLDQQHLLLLIPSLRWCWHWYVILLLASSIVVLLVWAPAASREMLKEQRRRHIQSFKEFKARNEKPPVVIIQGAAEPNIVPRVETVDVHRDADGNIVEGKGGRKSRAIVLRCKNEREIKPLRRVGNISSVSAQISYSGLAEDAQRLPEESAAWLSEKGGKVDFPVDATHILLVAIMEAKSDDLHLSAIQRRSAALAKAIRETPLTDQLYRVRVTWYADSEKDALTQRDYMLDLNTFGTGGPGLIPASLWKGHQILMFRIDGYKYLNRHHEEIGSLTNLDEMSQEQMELEIAITNWESTVSKFLGVHYSATTRSRFLGTKSIRLSGEAAQASSLRERLMTLPLPPDTASNLKRQLDLLERLDE